MGQIEIFLIFMAIVGIGFAVSRYLDSRRTKAVQAIANQLGFDYHGQFRRAIPRSVESSNLFNRGRNKHFKNLIHGQIETLPVTTFDYQYTVGSGKNKQTVRQTVVVIETQQALPQFLLKPETMFHKIGGLFGYQDIDFETHPDFSKGYCLQGPSEKAIRDCFFSDVLTFFEARRQLWVESTGDALMVYRKGRSHKPQDWHKAMNSACRVYRQF